MCFKPSCRVPETKEVCVWNQETVCLEPRILFALWLLIPKNDKHRPTTTFYEFLQSFYTTNSAVDASHNRWLCVFCTSKLPTVADGAATPEELLLKKEGAGQPRTVSSISPSINLPGRMLIRRRSETSPATAHASRVYAP